MGHSDGPLLFPNACPVDFMVNLKSQDNSFAGVAGQDSQLHPVQTL